MSENGAHSNRSWKVSNAPARVAAVILLAGSVRESPLARAAHRPILDLPLPDGRSILDHWRRHVAELRVALASNPVPLLIATNTQVEQLQAIVRTGADEEVVSDAERLRGTGGALADIARRFDPAEYLLVASAHCVLLDSVSSIFSALCSAPADVTLLVSSDHVATGLQLVRCGALRSIAATGYVDFKEQSLPSIAQSQDVRICVHPGQPLHRIRDLSTYLHALRMTSGRRAAAALPAAWQSEGFRVVESGAEVETGARLHDAVILRGARVASGAIVVRSLVAGDRVVTKQEIVVDEPAAASGA